ncbi:hypothetical protein [Thiolinea disciformis]|uniref:hypothetical protein n=1 Tax=Thiolinea disciformis TaxID=125614 RepID=UPI0012FEEE2D|nr:hypothetical protein [Thiolinea disciformis]
MKKTYTIESMTFKEISPCKGSAVWLLSDEKGMPRKVSGIVELDAKGLIEKINAIYSREEPLVESLKNRSEGDTFTIDFTGFNEQHSFPERDIYQNMRRHEQTQGLGRNAWRIVWVLLIMGLLMLAYTGVNSVVSMKDNFSTPLQRTR